MRKYLRQTVDTCREKGYVQTMLGRKRYLESITGTNPHARAQAERQTVNTAVQGSAADLVKMAMIEIDRKLMIVRLPINRKYMVNVQYSKTCVKRTLKNRQNKDLNHNW